MACIALLTDFGLDDPYVGQLKGVLASLAPQASIVDISHSVTPYDVYQGAFFLQSSLLWHPEGSVLVGVVDPGVGSSRKIIGFELEGRIILVPDNGLGSLLLASRPASVRNIVFYDISDFSAQKLSYAPVHLAHSTRTGTFHGRDIFAPAASALANGATLAELGQEIDSDGVKELVTYKRISSMLPQAASGGTAVRVLHVDRFGNCVLSLPEDYPLRLSDSIVLSLRCVRFKLAAATCYRDIPQNTAALIKGSQGYWEIAANMNSAAELIGITSGDEITLSKE